MNLQTKIPLTKSENQIDYNSKVFLLGSCFTENIGRKLQYFKFQSLQNPFGILFHPMAIEKLISKAMQRQTYSEADIFYAQERWHCFDAHSNLSDVSKEKYVEKLNRGLVETIRQISEATHIIITLGTAWVYRKKDTETVVANCHKVPQKEFSKELLSIYEIQNSIENIIGLVRPMNEKAQFIFTISPVRHLKDGFVENQRSKAHLLSAVHKVLQVYPSGTVGAYFPSYEILMDELRDYRFYENDMLHPNQLAIDYIWERFVEVWISTAVQQTMEKVEVIQKALLHRPFNAKSEGHTKFLKSVEEKIKHLQDLYPFMEFEMPQPFS